MNDLDDDKLQRRMNEWRAQEIMVQRKEADSGVRLEVNEKILSACTSLIQGFIYKSRDHSKKFENLCEHTTNVGLLTEIQSIDESLNKPQAVMLLVQKSRDLQQEIVSQGKGTGSVQDFYKRHHQWTEGLLSAAKSVGAGANFLVSSADRVVSGQGKFEELMAASQEIAASTAQLVVASKGSSTNQVKADRGSEKMSALGKASKSVTTATANVLGTVKSGQEILTEKESLDFSKLSLHQSKQAEMNCQVRVLELETSLQNERLKLGELRKHHYHMAGPEAGWEENSQNKEGSPAANGNSAG